MDTKVKDALIKCGLGIGAGVLGLAATTLGDAQLGNPVSAVSFIYAAIKIGETVVAQYFPIEAPVVAKAADAVAAEVLPKQ